MSASECLVTLGVALGIFGPKKLPLLAQHLGWCMNKINTLKQYYQQQWHHYREQLALQERIEQAQQADHQYRHHQNVEEN